jgi:hypothetical protein
MQKYEINGIGCRVRRRAAALHLNLRHIMAHYILEIKINPLLDLMESLSLSQQRQFDNLVNFDSRYGRGYEILDFLQGFQARIQLTFVALEKDRLKGG